MTRLPLHILTAVMFCLVSCTGRFDVSGSTGAEADIYPDYRDVTIPVNIAPLNFHINGEGPRAAILASGADTLWLMADDGDVVIPESDWRRLLQASPRVDVTVCRQQTDGRWTADSPFSMHVSPDSIDSHLVYRLLPPLYGTWRYMGIYQRCLENYDETAVYRNDAYHGNCVNCHSLCARDPARMQLHLRGEGGGTYLMRDDLRQRLDTKTDSTISNFTYPYWHPSGRYIAYSVNDIFQIFHTAGGSRIEVIDDDSDVLVYDIDRGEAFSCPQLRAKGVLETFPAFSPDGRRLYFCTAEHPGVLPEHYQDVHYSLCAIDFDPETRNFGERVDTLVAVGDSLSVSFPRPSPDGRRLALTIGAYGNFSIWHKDADLWMLDLAEGTLAPMTEANSPDVESYHSWSGNSRWLVYSSRRDDGLYTRPYFVHVDADGTLGRPFMLPQRRPRTFYADRMESYNIPEFSSDPVPLTTAEVVDWIACPARKVQYTGATEITKK